MRRPARILTIAAAALLALAPVLAEARPGGRASSGSRGARTYQAPPPTNTAPNQARPFERTQTEAARPAAPQAAPGALRPQGAQGGFFGRNPFLAGLLGGGLLGLMLGGGFLSGGFAGLLGVMLQLALIAGLVLLLMAVLRRRAQPAPAGMARTMEGGAPRLGGSAGAAAAPVSIAQADYAAFEALLRDVNAAWSARDLSALSRLATPEMVGYFRDDYAALDARGWRNETRDVRLEQGDLAETWREGAREYATVAMRFSLVDVTRETATGRVTEGDPERRDVATELWTFVRVPGGPWQLSAIQQTG
ncbi:TIM44-like domain-containing protein [Roseococcus sp. DSY-14]|uniref:TIM44-like domain-containing protein n=1 Tax=Roseococcus sp. DSY-14 TaxID=3369650 RepID=UPI00387ACBD2